MATIYRTTAILPLFASAFVDDDERMLIASLASLFGLALFVAYGWVLDRLLRSGRDAWCREVTGDEHGKTPPDPEI